MWTNCGGSFDIDRKLDEIAEREMLTQAPGFWDDAQNAQKVMRETSGLKDWVDAWKNAEQSVGDVQALIELAEEADDQSMESEIIAEADRSERIAPITTGLIPFSVPTSGNITMRTSFTEATESEVQIAGLIPGRWITSLALIAPAISRSSFDFRSFISLIATIGTSERNARTAAKIKAEDDDLGRTPADPAIKPPSIGPTV